MESIPAPQSSRPVPTAAPERQPEVWSRYEVTVRFRGEPPPYPSTSALVDLDEHLAVVVQARLEAVCHQIAEIHPQFVAEVWPR